METPNLKYLQKSEYFFVIFCFSRIKYTDERNTDSLGSERQNVLGELEEADGVEESMGGVEV